MALARAQEILGRLDPSPRGKEPRSRSAGGYVRLPAASWGIPDWSPFDEDEGDYGFSGVTPIRRIIAVPDKEGKTRLVAVLDYVSQTVLRPVHFFLSDVLRSIPQDMTFNQGGFVERVQA